jgi:protein-tyrosine-phosphatase
MAAGLLHHHAAGAVHVRSAGSAPAHEINPAVREAMAEIGLNISREFPKPLTDDVVQAADVVITMGCGDACPIYPGKRYLDWELDDSAGQGIDAVRPIRDEIARPRATRRAAQHHRVLTSAACQSSIPRARIMRRRLQAPSRSDVGLIGGLRPG